MTRSENPTVTLDCLSHRRSVLQVVELCSNLLIFIELSFLTCNMKNTSAYLTGFWGKIK